LGRFIAAATITGNHIIAVLLAIVGFGLLTMPQAGEEINIGDAITLLGTSFWALHIVYTSIWTKRAATHTLLLVQIVTGAILFSLSLFLLRSLGVTTVLANDIWPTNLEMGMQIVYLAIVATIGTILLQIRAQRYVSPTRAAIIFSLEPAFASLFSYLMLGEQLSWRAYLGGILIIAALIVSALRKSLVTKVSL
jgi:drug/metabolite transporter (DMT)-like permease